MHVSAIEQKLVSQSNFLTHTKKGSFFASKLNLVALMDIFTILVFFLLINQGPNEKLHNAKFVKIPESSASSVSEGNAILYIGEDKVWLDDALIANIDSFTDRRQKGYKLLKNALEAHLNDPARKDEVITADKKNSITIMAEHAVSYGLLHKIMATCNASNFHKISLAVNRIGSS